MAKEMKSKFKRMLNIFFDIKGIPHTTVTSYSDCVKVCEDFAPNFGDKRTVCCIITTLRPTIPFSPGIF
jgi:hypothetical protein